MLLTGFLNDLLTTGILTLAGRPTPFAENDLLAADALLAAYHAQDAQELPQQAPAFNAPAARWAAHYVYYTALLMLARELDEAVMETYLPPFTDELTPEVVYAVDLTFRYLPDLLHLAKGLAPGDALVARLHATASQWPFSFVGNESVDAATEGIVLSTSGTTAGLHRPHCGAARPGPRQPGPPTASRASSTRRLRRHTLA
jgi:hypothetical protein